MRSGDVRPVEQHAPFSPPCTGEVAAKRPEGAPDQLAHDCARTAFLTAEGWRVVRVTNEDVYKNIDGVWRTIEAALPPPAAAPPPPPHAGEETLHEALSHD